MKRPIVTGAVITVFAALAFTACKKEDKNGGNGSNPTGPYSSVSQVYTELRTPSKTVTIDAATGGSFRGLKGTRFIFPANAFRTAAGAGVTGSVQVEVREMLDHSDMIFSKLLPVSNNNPLISGGEVWVNATQNGQKLYLKNNTYFRANIPYDGNNGNGMLLFLGEASNDTNVTVVNWMPQDSMGAGGIIVGNDTLSVFSDSTGYCNADQFLTNPDYQSFTVNVTGVSGLAANNVMGYAVYDGYNSMWTLGGYTGSNFAASHIPDIPVHFVVFAVVNGNFYGGIAAATPSNGSTYTVNLSQMTPASFATQVDALP